jgi:hypothetical protein
MDIQYTIVTGKIQVNNKDYEIPFALVFYDKGLYYVETFVSNSCYDENKNNSYYTLIGKTEKGYDIEITGLSFSQYAYQNLKVVFYCYGHIKLSNNKESSYTKPPKEKYDDSIFLIELRGLEMAFANHTETKKYRSYGDTNTFPDIKFDHTSCTFVFNDFEDSGNHFHIIFTKGTKNNNMVIDFTHNTGYSRLTYKNYLKIRDRLRDFLCFINGGEVSIIKELTGEYVTTSKNEIIDSQIVYLFSVEEFHNKQLSDFLPINEHHSYSKGVIPQIFLNCFEPFCKLNSELNFNSLIFSLNNSKETIGLDEKHFILITALERLCFNYSKNITAKKETIIDKVTFQNEILPELSSVLSKYKSKIGTEDKSAFAILKSRLNNINRNNLNDTTQNLFEFLEYAKIDINEEVRNLVTKERNATVHEGNTGDSFEESIKNYLKLDHILRDIILNLIGYKSYRKYKFKYFEASH